MVALTTILIGLATLTVGAVVFILFRKFAGFNTTVIIHELRSGVRRVIIDKAKKIKKEGKYKTQYELKLRKKKKHITIPVGADIGVDKKGKDIIELYSPAEDQYYNTTFAIYEKDSEGNLQPIVKPVPTDMMLLLSLKTRQAFQRFNKKSDWEKLAPVITIAVTGIVMTIFIYVSVKELTAMSAVGASATKAAEQAGKYFVEASKNLLAAKGVTTPPV